MRLHLAPKRRTAPEAVIDSNRLDQVAAHQFQRPSTQSPSSARFAPPCGKDGQSRLEPVRSSGRFIRHLSEPSNPIRLPSLATGFRSPCQGRGGRRWPRVYTQAGAVQDRKRVHRPIQFASSPYGRCATGSAAEVLGQGAQGFRGSHRRARSMGVQFLRGQQVSLGAVEVYHQSRLTSSPTCGVGRGRAELQSGSFPVSPSGIRPGCLAGPPE
jgi:hypothetical protein